MKKEVKDTYTTARDLEDKTAKKNFEEWVRLYGDFFDLDNLPEADRKEALTKLYKANKSGYAVEDLSKLPIIWQVEVLSTFLHFPLTKPRGSDRIEIVKKGE